jgi:hypothetical protein
MSRAREFADLAGSADAGGITGKNLIINGAMQVWQRTTAATTVVNQSYQTVDRWIFYENTDGTYTTEQSTDTPNGTGYSLKAVVTGADTSIGASQYAAIEHYIEAQNCQHLLYGTSAAKNLTLSFWVKSSKTGTYTIALYKQDTTSYLYTKEYSINSANTWEKKEITISPTAGGTSFITSSGGAIANDSGLGLSVGFNLAWGSTFTGGTSDSWSSDTTNYSTTSAVNWMDTIGNTFLISEVQLEVGEQATPFEHRSYGDELARCQRYYHKSTAGLYATPSSGAFVAYVTWDFKVSMRTSPTITGGNGTWQNISPEFGNMYVGAGTYPFVASGATADAEL